jgi:hypothetical protein
MADWLGVGACCDDVDGECAGWGSEGTGVGIKVSETCNVDEYLEEYVVIRLGVAINVGVTVDTCVPVVFVLFTDETNGKKLNRYISNILFTNINI